VWSRLTKITWSTGKTTTFHYNALGERTKMVHVDAGVTRTEYYLYDGPRPIQRRSEATATSNIDREYFSGGERRWNTGTGAWVNHHFTRDHLGSVREVLDASGNLLARYDYAPYGERVTRYEASGYSSDIGFTGHFHLPSPISGQSEVLLAHYRAYDPLLGRWLSQDPIREAGGINLYGYVGGHVTGALDVWGLVDLNLITDSAVLVNALKLTDDPGFFTVGIHGTTGHVLDQTTQPYRWLTPAQLLEKMRDNGWDGKKPIKLYSCSAGNSVVGSEREPYGQSLANLAGVQVVAPSSPLRPIVDNSWRWKGQKQKVSFEFLLWGVDEINPDGKWLTFDPPKEQSFKANFSVQPDGSINLTNLSRCK
jgi:RHS repeat-associated protein